MENPHDTTGSPSPKFSRQPHDRLFKAVFKRPHLTRAVLEARLPPQLLSDLDLNTLHLSDSSRLNPNLGEDYSDVLLTCNNRKGKPVEIPFILEHKSYKPPYPPYQLVHY